jgi:hypothetical protein
MFTRMMKTSTPTGEQRWINLDRVTRVSLARDVEGVDMLVFCFDDHDHITIHGTDDHSRELIRQITASLDEVADTPGRRRVA